MKLSLQLFLFFSIVFFPFEKSLFAQPGINSNWVFGINAEVTFNSGVPVTVPGAIINANEGSASISDASGNLLFYTDGSVVMDRNNNQMPNGFGLLGNSSSTQSAVICPAPGNPNVYYIFTADQGGYGGPNQGVYFNTVDMTLNSGNGDVVLKNQLLDAPPMTEKIVAVRHCNGTDFWIIVHKFGSTEFDAFLLSAAGVNLTPVVSNVGTTETDLPPIDYAETIGYLKSSPDGHRLGVAVYEEADFGEVYDFDNLGGGISNPITFTPNPSTSSGDGEYGCSFSPDNSKFYLAWYSSGQSQIFQYDLSLSTNAAIIASQTLVGTITSGLAIGALQIAPNGKIYAVEAGGNYLDVINSPNLAGVACNFQLNAFTLTTGTCLNGLPNSVDAYIPSSGSINLGPDTTLCASTFTLSTSAIGQHLWSTGDTTSSITVDSTGTYWVSVQSSTCAGILSDTVHVTFINATAVNLGPDTITCKPSLTVNCPSPGPYLWNTGATTQSINATSTGNYWVTVGTASCHATDTIHVTFFTPSLVNLGPDTTICPNSTLVLDAGVPGATYLWSTGATTQNISVSQLGNYWVTVSQNTCVTSDSIHISVAPPLYLGEDVSLCGQFYASLNADSPGASYLWNTGQTTQNIDVSNAGQYWVQVNNGNCILSDTINVTGTPGDGVIFFPNTFTPNGDGRNETFNAEGVGIVAFNMMIFDRWGMLLYQTNDINAGWDGMFKGNLVQEDTYVYVVEYRTECADGKMQRVIGNVNVIR